MHQEPDGSMPTDLQRADGLSPFGTPLYADPRTIREMDERYKRLRRRALLRLTANVRRGQTSRLGRKRSVNKLNPWQDLCVTLKNAFR